MTLLTHHSDDYICAICYSTMMNPLFSSKNKSVSLLKRSSSVGWMSLDSLVSVVIRSMWTVTANKKLL